MLASYISSFAFAFALAFAALTDEQRLSYVGLTAEGFPFPYICEELTPKLLVKFNTLLEEEKKEWALSIFTVGTTATFVYGTTQDFNTAFAECVGFSAADDSQGVFDAYKKLTDEEKRQTRAQRRVNGGKARKEIQKWRRTQGLARLRVIYEDKKV